MGIRLPDNETERLNALLEHQILDTLPEQEYDDLVRLAAHLCGTPVAAIALVDKHRQWFKAITGLEAVETPRDIAFCTYTILQNDLLVVPDAQADPRFADNPFVTGDPSMRFYAGMPLMTDEGYALGTLFVVDTIPRQFTPDQANMLMLLARQVSSHLRAARRIAEYKEIEQALQESNSALQESQERLEAREQRLRLALNSGRLGIGELDKVTGQFLDTSATYKAHFGLPPDVELTRGMLFELTHPDDRDRVREAVRGAEIGRHTLEIEHRVVWPDGSVHWIKGFGQIIYDDTETACRMIGINQDITDRKLAEQALHDSVSAIQKSEAAMQALLESAPVILFATDIEGTVTLSKGSGLAVLGLKPDEAVGSSVFEFSRIDANIGQFVERALAGESASYDALVCGMWLHNELRPLRDSHGTVTGVIGVCFDVTERIASEEKFRVLFEWSSDAHLLFDENGIIDCNEAAVTMIGCIDKSQLLALHPAILSPEYQPDRRLSLEKCIEMDALARENGFHRFDWMHRKLDGTEFPVEVTLTPVTLANRPVMLVVWHDLSERKLAEKRLEEYSLVLEFQKCELEKANTELETLATTDGLTGLKNHRAFQERLSEEVTRSQRYGTPLSMIMLDVDRFKQYNDTFGHPAGDRVLKTVARILHNSARSTDLAARYGGEEFVILLPETDIEGASVFAERLRVSIESYAWPIRNITASCGAAVLRLGEESGAEMICRADQMLYRSKAAGRNRVTAEGTIVHASLQRAGREQKDWLGRERRRKRMT